MFINSLYICVHLNIYRSTLKKQKRATFVGFHSKNGPLLKNSMLNQKKGPLLSNFISKKGPLLRSSTYAKPKIKGSLLSNFTLKKVHL